MANKPLSNKKDGEQISTDKLALFKVMTDEVAGRIAKAIAEYHEHNCFDKLNETWTNGFDPGFPPDSQEYAFWQPFKNMLDAHNKAYLKECIKDRRNGLKGGRQRQPTGNPKQPMGNPTIPDNVNVNDNDKVTDNATENVIYPSVSSPYKSISDRMEDDDEDEIRKHLSDTEYKEVLDKIDEAFEGKDFRSIKNPIGYFRTTAKDMGFQWR